MRKASYSALLLALLSACGSRPPADDRGQPPTLSDSAFAALQGRGGAVMGVNQYTSTHHFTDLPDGGRIELQRDQADSAGVEQIRMHLQHIARAFAAGDFSDPGMVHQHQMPGTAVMAEKKAVITYDYTPLPRGGAVRITTRDPEALRAVHEFLAAQRGEHRAGGHARGPTYAVGLRSLDLVGGRVGRREGSAEMGGSSVGVAPAIRQIWRDFEPRRC